MYIIPKDGPEPHDDAPVICFLNVSVTVALPQLTDKMDPMYIIPKDWPEPHNDACVICFLSISNFSPRGPKNWFFLALAQLKYKIYPMYIIPKLLGYS